MSKITVLRSDDWEAYYKDGKLLAQHHEVEFSEVCEKLNIKISTYNPIFEILKREGFEVEDLGEDFSDDIYEHLQNNRRFPNELSEFVVKSKNLVVGDKVKGQLKEVGGVLDGVKFEGEIITKRPNAYEVKTAEGYILVVTESEIDKV